MIPDALRPLVRRAILDLLNDIGGEQSDDTISVLLAELGHRVARRDVRGEMIWLGEQSLIEAEMVGPYCVGRVLPDGRDIAIGKLTVDGVWRHKTGE